MLSKPRCDPAVPPEGTVHGCIVVIALRTAAGVILT